MAAKGPRGAHLRRKMRLQDVGTRILNVDRGPGWVLLFSPNAMIRWRISGAESDVTQVSTFETGPASAQAVWVGELGTVIVAQDIIAVLDTSFQANQDTGAAEAAPGSIERPSAGARYFPAGIYRKALSLIDPGQWVERYYAQPGPTSATVSGTMTLTGTIAAGATLPVGWSPGDRGQFQFHAAGPLTASITSGDPGKLPTTVFTGFPVDVGSVDMSPLNLISLSNPNPDPVDFSAHWRNVGATRQV